MAIIEPFLLIALGFLLKRTRRFSSKELWNGVEKLVFWVLFPPLLFNSVASAQLSGLNTAAFLAAGCFAMTGGIFMAKGVSVLAPADPMTDASVRQTGYRYNAYICFAMALNLYGKPWRPCWPVSGCLFPMRLPSRISRAPPTRDAARTCDPSSKTS